MRIVCGRDRWHGRIHHAFIFIDAAPCGAPMGGKKQAVPSLFGKKIIAFLPEEIKKIVGRSLLW